jgi:hypothetical protein
MLDQFILVSGWAFWVIIAGVVALDVFFLSSENYTDGAAVAVTAGLMLAIILFSDAFAGVRISTMIAAAVAYLALGVIWSVKKWYTFVVEKKKDLLDTYEKRVNKNSAGNETFVSYAKSFQPKASEYKTRIVGWMGLWPFSFSWWVLTWPRRAFVWLYDRLSTLFDRISAHIWSST